MHHALCLADQILHARPSGALFWPEKRLLCVSDLHLGKSERLARRGGALLPPYETRETLARLDAELEATQATRVICLGDTFDDSASFDGLDDTEHLWLTRMIAGRDWVWITGNHDPGPLNIAGQHLAEIRLDPLTFRHIAQPQTGPEAVAGTGAEVSGHYHPKARLAGSSWKCFLADERRLILPAFGTYTGGLWCHDPVFAPLMGPKALAVLCGQSARAIPMPRASTASR